jgi:dolichol kinase
MNAAYLQLIILIVLIVVFQVVVGRVGLEKEAQRRWQHALTGQALVGCSYLFDVWLCVAGLLFGLFGIACMKYMYPTEYQKLFGPLLRPHERDQLPGAFYFLLGTLLVLFLVPLETARYAVLCLSYADPAAAWIGRTIPLRKIHDSASVGGCLACFVTACVVGSAVLSSDQDENPVARILIGALVCTIAEALPVGNDNLMIPLLTALSVEWLL